MALYFLSYDLRAERDYQTLYDKLNEFDAVRVLESIWCFKRVDISAIRLRDYFKQFIDADDGLLVSESAAWAVFNTDGSPSNLG